MRIEKKYCVDCKHWDGPDTAEPCCNCRNMIPPIDPRFSETPVLWEPKHEPDMVNHPGHYETGNFECFDVMAEALGHELMLGFCAGNAFKYVYRHQRKNGLEDMKKARWYLDKYIELAEGVPK